MTIKALLEAIQDAKITADVVVSDRGRLHPVTKIQASANVVMLICRARPDWEVSSSGGVIKRLGRTHNPQEMEPSRRKVSEGR